MSSVTHLQSRKWNIWKLFLAVLTSTIFYQFTELPKSPEKVTLHKICKNLILDMPQLNFCYITSSFTWHKKSHKSQKIWNQEKIYINFKIFREIVGNTVKWRHNSNCHLWCLEWRPCSAQCVNLIIFLLLRFYVKLISVNSKSQQYDFCHFQRLRIYILLKLCIFIRLKFCKH